MSCVVSVGAHGDSAWSWLQVGEIPPEKLGLWSPKCAIAYELLQEHVEKDEGVIIVSTQVEMYVPPPPRFSSSIPLGRGAWSSRLTSHLFTGWSAGWSSSRTTSTRATRP